MVVVEIHIYIMLKLKILNYAKEHIQERDKSNNFNRWVQKQQSKTDGRIFFPGTNDGSTMGWVLDFSFTILVPVHTSMYLSVV